MPKKYSETEKTNIRRDLRRAAQRSLFHKGVRGTSVEDLVRQAAIPKATFYLFYRTKEDLYIDVLTDFRTTMQDEMLSLLQELDENHIVSSLTTVFMHLVENIYRKGINVDMLRAKVGMVFQKPNPFPKSIFENVAYGLRIAGVRDRVYIEETVENSLRGAALWDEVKDKLKKSAFELSGGQQQRLCIARALAVKPRIILMDEPASALDPLSTSKIEDLIYSLKNDYTIVIVTHNMQQAARVSDKTAFFYLGELIEYDDTRKMFTKPQKEATQNYITGRFG